MGEIQPHPATGNKICVCGAGTMGAGIAQVFAQHGFKTILFDLNNDILSKARERIEKKLPDAPILYTSNIEDCRADIIIEAIIEKEDIKAYLFNKLATINGDKTIFATNTSSLSVSAIAQKLSQPAQLAGMHFFNPAPVMKLVEIVSTEFTSKGITDTLTTLTKTIGKTPVLCKDAPGFIVNHVARPYYIEALHLAQQYNIPFENIDNLMEASGFKMGPFRLMDLIGNDINYSVSCIVYDALGKPERLKPSPIQKEKVDNGNLGRKTGKGYYEYPTT
jgi:3-hydroxybutyryl-CoA dehydrogenase